KEQSQRENHFLRVIAYLKPEVTRQQAQAETEIITRRIGQEHAADHREMIATVVPAHEHYVRELRPALHILLVAEGFPPADCLCQRGHPAPGSHHRAAKRNGDPHCAGCQSAAHHSTVTYRKHLALRVVWFIGTVAGLLGDWPVDGFSLGAGSSPVGDPSGWPS